MFTHTLNRASKFLNEKNIAHSMFNGCKLDHELQHIALDEPIIIKGKDVPRDCEVLYECYLTDDHNPDFYMFKNPTKNKKIVRFVTIIYKKGDVDYKNPMIKYPLFSKKPKAEKTKAEKKTDRDNFKRAAWRTLVNVSMAYAQMSQEEPDEDDEDEDEPILHEIKGPDLAVSTRFG